MTTPIRAVTVSLTALLAAASVLFWSRPSEGSTGVQVPRASDSQAFTNVHVFDGTGAPVVENGVVVVREGRVEAVGTAAELAVPEDAVVVDLGGRWLVPGLVNAHGHVSGDRATAIEQLDQYAYYGVTTVVSLGDDAANLRDERWSPELRRARLFVAGPNVVPTTPQEARETIDRLAGMEVDWVKTRIVDDRMSEETYRALTSAAAAREIPVAIHIEDLASAKLAVRGGGSLVGHSVRDLPVDAELIELLRERDVCLVPTLTRELSTFVYAERPDFFDDPFFLERAAPEDLDGFLTPQLRAQSRSESARYWREALPLAKSNMVRLHEAGIGIAMGTDTGPTGRFQGYFEHVELEMMADAGLPPEEVLRSATGRSAACVGLAGAVGTVEPGASADFLVLDADPREDIRNTREIHGVWIAGNRVR
jgi:imidazolonepropionase-like amidohydrolase